MFEKGYFQSREKAKAAIMAGIVFVNDSKIDKAGTPVEETAEILVKDNICPYVSRGGLKLEKALELYGFSLENAVCADIGAYYRRLHRLYASKGRQQGLCNRCGLRPA